MTDIKLVKAVSIFLTKIVLVVHEKVTKVFTEKTTNFGEKCALSHEFFQVKMLAYFWWTIQMGEKNIMLKAVFMANGHIQNI